MAYSAVSASENSQIALDCFVRCVSTKVEYSDGAEMQKQYKMELNDSTSTSNNNSNDSSIKSK